MVTPLVGVWIEIYNCRRSYRCDQVTPLVGVWIEISITDTKFLLMLSLPLWECGLKFL